MVDLIWFWPVSVPLSYSNGISHSHFSIQFFSPLSFFPRFFHPYLYTLGIFCPRYFLHQIFHADIFHYGDSPPRYFHPLGISSPRVCYPGLFPHKIPHLIFSITSRFLLPLGQFPQIFFPPLFMLDFVSPTNSFPICFLTLGVSLYSIPFAGLFGKTAT